MTQPNDPKLATRAAYDRYADRYAAKFHSHWQAVQPLADQFIEHLAGPDVLDIGCGAGEHAAYFSGCGLRVTAGDIAPAMVALAQERGLDARELDLEYLPFDPATFDGIWAYTSLLHLPKNRLGPVARQLVRVLRPGRILGLGVKEGTDEGPEIERVGYQGVRRWFSYFQPGEINELFPGLAELAVNRLVDPPNIFLQYLFRKT